MKKKKIKAWFPTIRAGSGTDVFTMRLADALESQGVETQITWFPLRYEFAPFLLKKTPPPPGTNIIFTNSWNGFAFKRKDIPLVVTSHHPEYTATGSKMNVIKNIYHRFLIRRYEKLSFDAANIITTDSEFTASSLKKTVYANKTHVIYLWVDVQKFSPVESNTEEKARPFRLLFVGNFSYRKGADLLPKIMEQLGNDFHLDIIAHLNKKEILPFPENISILGRVSEEKLVDAYRNCDALLFPSRWEGFGYVALEAMACGKPVITSNAAALPEVVINGETGVLCQSGDVNAFVAACRQLSTEPTYTKSMGASGRQRAIEVFSEEVLIQRYLELIENLIFS